MLSLMRRMGKVGRSNESVICFLFVNMYFPCRAQLQLKDSVGLSLTGGNKF